MGKEVLFSVIVYADGVAAREFAANTIEEVRDLLFDVFKSRPIHPRGPYVQVRILYQPTQTWVDPDGGPANHPDGFCNVELRIQCGRGIL